MKSKKSFCLVIQKRYSNFEENPPLHFFIRAKRSLLPCTGKKFKIPRLEKRIFRVGKKLNLSWNFTQECYSSPRQELGQIPRYGKMKFGQEMTCFWVRILYFSYAFSYPNLNNFRYKFIYIPMNFRAGILLFSDWNVTISYAVMYNFGQGFSQ